VALIVVARIAMRKLFPAASIGRSSQVIRVVSRSVLAPKQQFLLLRVGKRLIVVGDSGGNMNALAEITDPDEVAAIVGQLATESSTSASATFGSLFRRASTEYSATSEVAGRGQPESDGATEATDPQLVAASGEIGSLLERVRGLSRHLKRS
jgi:flagellar biogenesis protein FliO